jgi:plastocyanin
MRSRSCKTPALVRLAAVLVPALVLAPACDDDDDDDVQAGIVDAGVAADAAVPPAVDAAPLPGPRYTIVILDNVFDPQTLTARVGDTVRWANYGNTPQTVTSGINSTTAGAGELFDQRLEVGNTFQYTFGVAGTYDFFSRLSEGTRGTITVTE